MDFSSYNNAKTEKHIGQLIFEALKEVGGQLTREEAINAICQKDDELALFQQHVRVSKNTGAKYKPFNFKFNFALKNLRIAGIVQPKDSSNTISLSERGENIAKDEFDIEKIYEATEPYWNDKKNARLAKDEEAKGNETTEVTQEEKYYDQYKTDLLEKISKMSPGKFESFSRKLLKQMGVSFTEKGTQISNDGGIDGYGYHQDENDFRTTRVVIQCKRYNSNAVSSPDIDKFRGAMAKFGADYGIFITNNTFTKSAREAAEQGSPITLIDGNALVELITKYQLGIKVIKAYEISDLYDE